jgi:3-methyladenine DNA glycosylase Mpg
MLCKLLLIHVERDIEWLAAGGVIVEHGAYACACDAGSLAPRPHRATWRAVSDMALSTCCEITLW